MKTSSRGRRRKQGSEAVGGRWPPKALLAAEVLVLGVVLVPPLVFLPTLADAFDLPKLLVSEWLGLASLAVLAWRLRGLERIDVRRVWAVPALAATVPLVAVLTATIATSAHPGHVRATLPDLWIGAACLVGWSVGLSERAHRRLQAGLLVPAGVLALLAILQFHDLYRPFSFSGGEETDRLGISSLAGNPGVLAAYLVLPVLIAQRLLRRWWRGGRKGAAGAAIGAVLALCVYGVVVTQTLAAVAAISVASAVLWLGLLPARRRAPALGAVALVAVVSVGVAAAVPAFRSRVMNKAGQVASGRLNVALSGRLDGWRAAVEMMAERPLTGVGQGAFSAEFADVKLKLQGRGAQFYGDAPRAMFVNAHNDLLELGAVGGVPALVALGWGLWRLTSGLGWRRSGRGPSGGGTAPAVAESREDRALAWAGLTALALLALFHFPFHVALVAYPALLFLAWTFHTSGGGEG